MVIEIQSPHLDVVLVVCSVIYLLHELDGLLWKCLLHPHGATFDILVPVVSSLDLLTWLQVILALHMHKPPIVQWLCLSLLCHLHFYPLPLYICDCRLLLLISEFACIFMFLFAPCLARDKYLEDFITHCFWEGTRLEIQTFSQISRDELILKIGFLGLTPGSE